MKEELQESHAGRESQDEDSFNLEQCMTANAHMINENKGYQAEIKMLKAQILN